MRYSFGHHSGKLQPMSNGGLLLVLQFCIARASIWSTTKTSIEDKKSAFLSHPNHQQANTEPKIITNNPLFFLNRHTQPKRTSNDDITPIKQLNALPREFYANPEHRRSSLGTSPHDRGATSQEPLSAYPSRPRAGHTLRGTECDSRFGIAGTECELLKRRARRGQRNGTEGGEGRRDG